METPVGFSASNAGIYGCPCGKRNEPCLLPHFIHRIKLRWIRYQNVKHEIIKVGEKIREGLHDVIVGKHLKKV